MIVYDLRCAKEHVFEAWFQSSDACVDQIAARKVACPECGSRKVSKAPMAPNIARSRAADKPAAPADPRVEAVAALRKLRAEVERTSEHVGAAFPEEARKIHYGEAEARTIHGDATPDEARELSDEGVDFAVIPWVPREDA